MIRTFKPVLRDLWFREKLLSDEQTMSYNAAWRGAIPFAKEEWERWFSAWLEVSEYQRYYRYLYETDTKAFVGEIAYHYDEQRKKYFCDVIVLAEYRNRGFGTAGIELICKAAKENGIPVLYDDIAIGNPSYKLFLKNGFEIDYKDDDVVMVKKEL